MRSKGSVVLVVALVICVCSGAFATDIFVATNGSDSNLGTIEQPLATLRAATNWRWPGTHLSARGRVQHDYWDVGGNGAPGSTSPLWLTMETGRSTAGRRKQSTRLVLPAPIRQVIGLEISGACVSTWITASTSTQRLHTRPRQR
jgi:hypothetical protein